MKERLVGAAVLVAIAAWLIPWVLDGPERVTSPQSTTLELPTPTADAPPMRAETVVLDRRDSPVPRETTEASPREIPEPSQAAVPEPPAVTAAPAIVPAKPDVPPVSDAPAPETETPAPAAAGEMRWYVQLGAFGDRGNADRLAARVSTFGHQAHVSAFPSAGRTVYRVRVGPDSTRARSEAIASALSAHGFVAQVMFE